MTSIIKGFKDKLELDKYTAMEVASLCLIQEIVFVHNNSIDLQLAKVAYRALHIGEQSVNCYKPACTTLPVADLATFIFHLCGIPGHQYVTNARNSES